MDKRVLSGLLLVLILAILVIQPAKGLHQDQTSSATALDGIITIFDDTSLEEMQPVTAYNSVRKEYLVVWCNDRPGNDDLRGIRLASDGRILGSPFYIAAGAGAERINHDVAYDYTNDQYLVVWEQYNTNYINNLGIFGRRVDGSGAVLGTSDILIRSVSGDIEATTEPAVDYAYTSNDFLVVWSETLQTPVTNKDILGQVVAIDGSLTGTAFSISDDPGDGTYRQDPDLAYNRHANRFLVAWEQKFSDTNWDIYAQQVHGAGGLYGSAFIIAYYTAPTVNPAVAAIPTTPGNEKFLIVFELQYSSTDRDIYARVVTEEGAIIPEIGGTIYVADSTNSETNPSIAGSESNDTYLVTWRENLTTIKSRKVSYDGTLAPDTDHIYTGAIDARYPSVAAGPVGDYLIVFDSDITPTFAILGRLYGIRNYLPLILR
jgi:hypothetical protein